MAFIDTWNTLRQHQGWTKDQLFEVSATKDKWEIGESLAEIVSDGIHFTAKSYKILFEEIIRVIEEKYPELAPETCPRNFVTGNKSTPTTCRRFSTKKVVYLLNSVDPYSSKSLRVTPFSSCIVK